MKTTELDKLKKVSEDSNKIGAFLDWLMTEKGYFWCKYGDGSKGEWEDRLYPVRDSIEQMLAAYFDIDLVKCEKERQKILDSLIK